MAAQHHASTDRRLALLAFRPLIVSVRQNTRAEDVMPAGPSPLGFTYFAAVNWPASRRPVSGSTAVTGSRREDRSLWVSPGRSLGIAAGFAFGFLALGFAVTKSERAPLCQETGNPEDFRYMLRSRSEAAVKGSRSEPRSGRRPLTVRPSEGYAFSPADSVFSTLSATAFR
jgi:hypothetical protein